VMKRRLETACHLMMTSSESLSQIALTVGFSDQSHLCKRFKQAFGESPSNWRRERENVGIPLRTNDGETGPPKYRSGSRLVRNLQEDRSSPQLASTD
jgi:AraC-like DNA-binding protein